MIKTEKINDGIKVETSGSSFELLLELLSVIQSIVDLMPDELQDEFINDLPTLIREHRKTLKSEVRIDADVLNKLKGE